MKGLFCPRCNSDKHIPIHEKDNLYVCSECGKVLGYLCGGCDRIYLENRLAFHRNVYICKRCGCIQWGYTQYKKRERPI